MKKRLICILLTLCMLVSLMPVAAFATDSGMPFTDVKKTDWFYEAVQYAYENGLMNGTGDNQFSPNATITRSMIVTILYRMEGEPATVGEKFADVAADQYYADAVAWASANGIVEGYSNDKFGPDDPVTREQLATILYRYMQYKGYTADASGNLALFADGVSVSDYAVKAMKWAVGIGLIKGTDGNRLAPLGTATRAEAATMFMRFCMGVVPVEYAVTFKYNYEDKGVYIVGLVAEGETVGVPAAPEREGYTFDGWYTSADCSTEYDFAAAVTASLTLYAKWTDAEVAPEPSPEPSPEPTPDVPKTYTVTFEYNLANQGTYKTVAVEDGKTVEQPGFLSYGNYYVVGWYTEAAGGQRFDFDTPITADITLYAKWREYITTPTTPAVKTYTVTFDTRGGSEIESQTVEEGKTVEFPPDPVREGFAFVGWYQAPGYSTTYNFASKVYSDVTLYAKWYDTVNTVDSDNDGLSDALEIEMGTDPSNSDTDNDGLSDYMELNWLDYNPLSADTDANNVLDKDEDPDNDGLTNEQEGQLGTNPIYRDTDFDGLTDGEEVRLGTDPLCADTDGDGVPDGVEVRIGTDPLTPDGEFQTQQNSGEVSQLTPVAASASVSTDAAGAGTLTISPVSILDNLLLSQSIAGYLGNAYSFETKGAFKHATITFTYDTALGTIGDDFQPRIYYYNEETQLLEELENQTVTDGAVTVEVEHFSTYILLNKVDFDTAWSKEIKPPEAGSESQYTGIDVVFVMDSSGSMDWNDSNKIRKIAAKAFVDKLGENDRGAVVSFTSSAYVYQNLTDDHNALYTAIDRVGDSGGTSLSAGISKAISLLTGTDYTRTDAYKYVIFLTDGDGSYSTTYTTQAKDSSIVIYTIGLGSEVVESLLREIAEGTGGKYFFASTADDLPDIYTEISVETVDYTTDSNNDGISDYYTKLLNDGDLLLGTGSYDLIGVTDEKGTDCDDWDGDGLKNGEEITVYTVGNRVYVKMESHPLIVDTDGDGLTDKQEKDRGLPRMKYTVLGGLDLDYLEDDSRYEYAEDYANNDSWIADANAFFSCKKYDQAKGLLINYFYDYASQETIGENVKAIEKYKKQEIYLGWGTAVVNIAKAFKNFADFLDDIDDIENIEAGKNEEAEVIVDNLLSKKEICKEKIIKLQEKTTTLINTGKGYNEVFGAVEDLLEFCETFSEEDFFVFAASIAEKLTSAFSNFTGVIKTGMALFKYTKLDVSLKPISNVYKDFLDAKNVTASTWIGAAFDVVDGVVNIAETSLTYGKIKANLEAYQAYIELLNYVGENGYEDYIKDAASDIAQIVMDTSWEEYSSQLLAANGKTFLGTAIKTAFNIASDASPYIKVVKIAADAIELSIKLSGKSANAQLILSAKTINSLSAGCISIIEDNVDGNQGMSGAFFSYNKSDEDFIFKYIVQLAQSRVVGENAVKERRLKNDLATWWANQGASDEEIEELYSSIIALIYTSINWLELEVSPNLPYYSEYYTASGGARFEN